MMDQEVIQSAAMQQLVHEVVRDSWNEGFWGYEEVTLPANTQKCLRFKPKTESERREYLQSSPLWRLVGNEGVRQRLIRIAFTALGEITHMCERNFAFVGPHGIGKSRMARAFAATVKLPFIELHGQAIRRSEDIFYAVAETFQKIRTPDLRNSLELVPHQMEWDRFSIPPCVVIVNNLERLKPEVAALLRCASDEHDGLLIMENFRADCRAVCWVLEVADVSLLSPGWAAEVVQFHLCTLAEIDDIIRTEAGVWMRDVRSKLASRSRRIPGEAIAFAMEVNDEAGATGTAMEKCIPRIAWERDLDLGMTHTHVAILTMLGQDGPASSEQIAGALGVCRDSMLDILPDLLLDAPDRSHLVSRCAQQLRITSNGLHELDRRCIRHKSRRALGS